MTSQFHFSGDPEALGQARPARSRFFIAIQCWSFKKFTLWESIRMAAAAGADAVELYPGQKIGGPLGKLRLRPSLADDSIRAILDHCGEHGIAPVNFGVTRISKDEWKAREVFEFAGKLGLLGVTTESIGSIDTLERLAAEFDLKVCFHNHPRWIGYRMWNPDFVFGRVEDRHRNLGICADVGHWATSGLVPLEVVRKFAPRIHSFHMKDRERLGRSSHDRPLGTGIIDPGAIVDEVRRHGFTGNVSIEYEHHWKSSLPEIAECVAYLRGLPAMAV